MIDSLLFNVEEDRMCLFDVRINVVQCGIGVAARRMEMDLSDDGPIVVQCERRGGGESIEMGLSNDGSIVLNVVEEEKADRG